MAKGLDTNEVLTNYGGHLKALGYEWVGRYINTNKPTCLTKQEAQTLTADGLYIVSIWERGYPTQVAYFTSAQGTSDAVGAVSDAVTLGQPKGTPGYFTVDYDATYQDLVSIGLYFAAIRRIVLPAGYKVGVYGNGLVCQYLVEAGLVEYTWLAQPPDWGGRQMWLPKADIVQEMQQTVLGLDVDPCESNGNAGGWQTS